MGYIVRKAYKKRALTAHSVQPSAHVNGVSVHRGDVLSGGRVGYERLAD